MIPVELDFDVIRLMAARIVTFDPMCPFCSAFRSSPANTRVKVFGIYRTDRDFARYPCIHFSESGHARDGHATPLDPEKVAKARARAQRLNEVRWLWSQRKRITRSTAETCLRTKRGATALRAAVENRKIDLTKPAVLQADRWRLPR
jgi:hypothetical protein